MMEQIRFNEVMAEIAQEIMKIVHSLSQADHNWHEAYVEARFDPEGGACLSKFRLTLKNSSVLAAETTVKTSLLLKELWNLRPFCISNSWFGVTIVVTPSGDCRTNFNFDPDCIGDPHFFDE